MKLKDYIWLLEEVLQRWGCVDAHHGDYPANYPRKLEGRFRTEDGRELTIRPIRPDDIELLKEGFARLSPETIYRRFHGHVKELSHEAYRALTHVDYVHQLALVAIDETEGGVGVARYYRPENSDIAEAAVVVVDDWQGRGVGRHLLSRLVDAARRQGIVGFEAYVQSDNHRMLEIIERSGYSVNTEDQQEGVIRIWFSFDA